MPGWFAGNVSAAAAMFMTEDPRAARWLLAGGEMFGDLGAQATETHAARFRAGRVSKASRPGRRVSTCCAT